MAKSEIDLQALSGATADALQGHTGVDGVIVILLRSGELHNGNGDFGAAARGPNLPFDGLFGCAVEALVELRKAAIRKVYREATKD